MRISILCRGILVDVFVFAVAFLMFPAEASRQATGDALGIVAPQ